jgi:dephospho-CoA kinase
MLIGLTGACCSGKNALAEILARAGWQCIDVDSLGHQALQLVKDQLGASFGSEALLADGNPDRAWLGKLVFSDANKLAALEALVHPKMFELADQAIDSAKAAGWPVCLNAAILYKMPQAARCDHIIEVKAICFLRLLRAKQRDRLPLRVIMARMRSQSTLLARRSNYADRLLYITNNLSYKELAKKTYRLSNLLMLNNRDDSSTDSP